MQNLAGEFVAISAIYDASNSRSSEPNGRSARSPFESLFETFGIDRNRPVNRIVSRLMLQVLGRTDERRN